LISPLVVVACVGGHDEPIEYVLKPASRANDEHSRQVATIREMGPQETRHCSFIKGDHDMTLALRPPQDLRIAGAAWQVDEISTRCAWTNSVELALCRTMANERAPGTFSSSRHRKAMTG
jgi:hypothetical protein